MSEQINMFEKESDLPLAARLRPRNLDEFVGQKHLLGEGKVLRRLIENDNIGSMIFWGPPGVGKTTLARIIAGMTKSQFIDFSAVTSGIKEIKQVMEQAERNRRFGERTILFVDEIHRFNKAQQDAFLPYVERGSIVLIGATTENPSFEVNGALLSNFANGDARSALSTLEMAVLNGELDGETTRVTRETVGQCTSKKSLLYDKNGEEHYNLISALHKSMRNSDPDAAVYWLARMLEAGEDPIYVARRVTRFASEDVGLADPRALEIAVAAYQACHLIGMPECSVHLTEAVVYMSLAPKSNALYVAYESAKKDALTMLAEPVPLVIRNAPTKLMKNLGYGDGYQYAHNPDDKLTDMQCMPESLKDKTYYHPTEEGLEGRFKTRLDEIKAWKRAHAKKKGKE